MCGIYLSTNKFYSSLEKVNIAKKSLKDRGPMTLILLILKMTSQCCILD